MSILENLDRIETAKQKIKEAIIAKGIKVTDTDKLDSYAEKIGLIKDNGGLEVAAHFRICTCNFSTFNTIINNTIRIGTFIKDA